MAPSRDRLLHFGFKATVSERGRKRDGWEGRLLAARALGEGATRLRGPGRRDRTLRCSLGWRAPRARAAERRAPAPRAAAGLPVCGVRARAHAPAPRLLPDTNAHRHSGTSLPLLLALGLACLGPESRLAPPPLPRSGFSGADGRRLRPGVGEGWSRAAAAARSSSPPPHAVPRPGRLYPMRSGVAGRWGVFLFWVEVEAEGREELATSSRRRCRRRGRRRRPRLSREVPPRPPLAVPARRSSASSPSRSCRACPGPLVFALRSPQRRAPAAPAGPMRRDVNGVTKSRFEV